jgi:hypothetical protein
MRTQRFGLPVIQSLAVVLAVLIPGFCLVIGAGPVHAADTGCPSSASSPQFCARAGGPDQALPMLALPEIPQSPAPEPGDWLPVATVTPPRVRVHAGVPNPRAPPLLPA